MSKKAEELAIEVFQALYGTTLAWLRGPDGYTGRIKAAALIDAELRKERERCAQILRFDADTLARNGMEQKAQGLRRGALLILESD